MTVLSSLARGAPVPVFCAASASGRDRARFLHLDRGLRIVRSPRHAAVLLVAGRLPGAHHDALRRIHDQVCAPRAALAWGAEKDPPVPVAGHVSAEEHPGTALRQLFSELIGGDRTSAPPIGPRDNPVSWQGEGPHGQGGEGMMGGTPYGRGMAMTGPDRRDGLQLDRVQLTLGPFLPWLPPGVRVHLELQGDVLQSLEVDVAGGSDEPEVFRTAGVRAVPLADLELARARHHLGIVADLLLLVGLAGLARRTLRLARDARAGDGDRVRALDAALRRTRALVLATRGIGRSPNASLREQGVLARAAGRAEDARARDPAYRDLGFETLHRDAGDAEARWQQRLAEAAQALDLAARAGERTRTPGAPLEGVRGGPDRTRPADVRAALEALAPGMAFDAFATTLVSLDADLWDGAGHG